MKKILGSLICALLLTFIFGTTVSAAQLSSEDIINLVNHTNYSIDQEIIKAQTQADILTKKYDTIANQLEKEEQVFSINNNAGTLSVQLLEKIKSNYDQEMDRIIDRLIQRTNDMANNTISIAAENGYTVICEMVEVQVGDRIVLVDPLRVSDT
jgi:fructose-1,6-bisphosphatase